MRESRRWCVLAAWCASCASVAVDPRADHAHARELIEASTGRAEVFDPQAPPPTEAELDLVVADGLALDEALRLALLCNRRLQAGFAGLGVARADVVQSGLLANPRLGVALLLPTDGGRPKIAVDLFQSLVDVWELPERERVAEIALAQQVLEVSRLAGELVVDTQRAYFECVAARELADAARGGAELSRQVLAAVERRVEAGVANEVERNLARAACADAELELRRAEREGLSACRELAALLSLERDLIDVELSDALPQRAPVELDREALVVRSRATRLDLRAAAEVVAAAEAEVALQRARTTPAIELGVAAERPEAGASSDLLVGPAGSIELPLFDRNQARIARAEYRRDELEHEHQALAIDVAQQVRAAADRAAASERTARFVIDELSPQAERNVELARKSYELGRTTALELLAAQAAALGARRERVEALLEAARARTELERALGASLDVLARD